MAWTDITRLCALRRPRNLMAPWWLALLLLPLAFWAVLWSSSPPIRGAPLPLAVLASVMLWQPLVEEFCFRGILQGLLLEHLPPSPLFNQLTRANLVTSVLFGAAHLLTHPWAWSLGIGLVSLLFGYARERTGSLYPALFLHIYYNAGYFLSAGA